MQLTRQAVFDLMLMTGYRVNDFSKYIMYNLEASLLQLCRGRKCKWPIIDSDESRTKGNADSKGRI